MLALPHIMHYKSPDPNCSLPLTYAQGKGTLLKNTPVTVPLWHTNLKNLHGMTCGCVCIHNGWNHNNVHVSKLTTCMDRISLPGPSFDILTRLTTNYSCNMYTRDLFCKWLQDWVHLSLTYTGADPGGGGWGG